MTTATLDQVDDALFAQLSTLLKENGGDFLQHERHVGTPSRVRAAIQRLITRPPGWLLATPGGDAVKENTVDTLLGGAERVVERGAWHVYVVVGAPRGDKQALKSPTGTSGLLKLVGQVRAALHGLVVAGLYDDRPVAYVGWRPFETTEADAQFVAVVKVTADLALDMFDQTETTDEPLVIAGTVHKVGGYAESEPEGDVAFITDELT